MSIEPVTILQSDIDAYARVSGDFNPIHVDPEFAKTTPYGSTIAHGTISSALITRQLMDTIGPGRRVKRLSLRFVGPIRSGDRLQSRVELTPAGLTPDATGAADSDDQTYTVSTCNQDDKTIATGEALVGKALP